MAASPQFKVYNPSGAYIAACKHGEDAACLVALNGDGSTIRHGHSLIIWREGAEEISAADSYDAATATMHARIQAAWAKGRAASG